MIFERHGQCVPVPPWHPSTFLFVKARIHQSNATDLNLPTTSIMKRIHPYTNQNPLTTRNSTTPSRRTRHVASRVAPRLRWADVPTEAKTAANVDMAFLTAAQNLVEMRRCTRLVPRTGRVVLFGEVRDEKMEIHTLTLDR